MSKNDEGAAAAMSSTAFMVSVLRCRKTKQVLFVEAGKDFVDMLFSFLLLPVGTIIHMLSTAGRVHAKPPDCYGNIQTVLPLRGMWSIYESVEKLDCSDLLQYVDKKSLVQPRAAIAGTRGSTGLFQRLEEATLLTRFSEEGGVKLPADYYQCISKYRCSKLSSTQGTTCSACTDSYYRQYSSRRHKQRFDQAMTVLPEDLESLKAKICKQLVEEDILFETEANCSSTSQGFVRENISYMVTDNLEVMPFTTITRIEVLNNLEAVTLADLEISSDISVSITQMLQLLQSAVTSNSCLNDVFGMK